AVVIPPWSNRWREFLCWTYRSVLLTKPGCRSSIHGSKNQTIRVGFRSMRCLSVRGTTILASTVYMKHCFWSVMTGRTYCGLSPHTPKSLPSKIWLHARAVIPSGSNLKLLAAVSVALHARGLRIKRRCAFWTRLSVEGFRMSFHDHHICQAC